MPDSYYDQVIAIALDIPGLWLADSQRHPGVSLSTDRAVPELAAELERRLRGAALRVDGFRCPDGGAEASMTVINEIDRQCWVTIHGE